MKSNSFVNALTASTKPAEELASLLRPLTLRDWFLGYMHGVWVVTEIEIRKLWHDPFELITRVVQPALWLIIFGQALSRLRAIPTGSVSYLTF